LKVSEVVNKNAVIIRPDLHFNELLELVVSRPNTQFFVIDHQNRFVGSISLQDVRRVLLDQDYLTDLIIALDLVNTDIPRLKLADDLDSVMKIFGSYDLEELPVVDSRVETKIIGAVNRKDVIDIYNRELVKRNLSNELSGSVHLLERMETIDFIDDYVMSEILVPPSFTNKSIKDIDLRAVYGVQVLMLKRQNEEGEINQIIPSPNEVLQINDRLVVLGKNKDIEKLKHLG
jgi:CIC family chloride channel protein